MLDKKSLVKMILGLILLIPFALACLLVPADKMGKDDLLFIRGLGIVFLLAFVGLFVLVWKSWRAAGKRAEVAKEPPPPQAGMPLSGQELPPPLEENGVFSCGYFKASRRFIGGDVKSGTCQLCGQAGDCLRIHKDWVKPNRYVYFIADYEAVKPRLEAASGGTDCYRVCVDCLGRGKIWYCHPTDLGYLRPSGFPGEVLNDQQKRIPHRAIAELFRTPPIKTNQEESWQTHCDDFMDFIGVWERADFARHAPNGNAEMLYAEMGGGDKPWAEWGSLGETYYAFRCRHCGKFRGYYDLD